MIRVEGIKLLETIWITPTRLDIGRGNAKKPADMRCVEQTIRDGGLLCMGLG